MIRFLKSTALAALLSCSAITVVADVPTGAYLAGRQALHQFQFAQAAQYFTRALSRDQKNPVLMEGAMRAYLSLGDIKRALPVARLMQQTGAQGQTGNMVLLAEQVLAEDFEAIAARDPEKDSIGGLVDQLVQAWTSLGQGKSTQAFTLFDEIAKQEGMAGFAAYHKAMAYALVGDFDSAARLFADEATGISKSTRRGAMAYAEVLSQLNRNQEALASLQQTFGNSADPELTRLIERLQDGQTVPFTHVTSAKEGIAEIFYSLASSLRRETGPAYTLLYSRLAYIFSPTHIDALLLNAQLLEELQQYELAIKAYEQVPATHISSHAAELGRAEAFRRSGQPDKAIQILKDLARRYPDMALIYSTMGDIQREQEAFDAAILSYNKTLELLPEGLPGRWFTYYARAISHERTGHWPAAEADFRKALEIQPDQPQVLNYLGYSMVEQKTNLDEALDMIERAAAARPEAGFIIDSLGWVLFRLGRYSEAVPHMERAVELMPVDPVVNDHLGDVYWAVNRLREARFQWNRALSFIDPQEPDSEADPERIRRKLEIGLDMVLKEENAPPLKEQNVNK